MLSRTFLPAINTDWSLIAQSAPELAFIELLKTLPVKWFDYSWTVALFVSLLTAISTHFFLLFAKYIFAHRINGILSYLAEMVPVRVYQLRLAGIKCSKHTLYERVCLIHFEGCNYSNYSITKCCFFTIYVLRVYIKPGWVQE